MAEAGAPRRRARPVSVGRGQCDQLGGGLGEMILQLAVETLAAIVPLAPLS
jgi:hypothetical protein